MDSQIDSVKTDTTNAVAALRSMRPEKGPNQNVFQKEFDLEVGKTLVVDRETDEEQIMWKVKGDGEEHVSHSVMDAVMGCLEKITGGEL